MNSGSTLPTPSSAVSFVSSSPWKIGCNARFQASWAGLKAEDAAGMLKKGLMWISYFIGEF